MILTRNLTFFYFSICKSGFLLRSSNYSFLFIIFVLSIFTIASVRMSSCICQIISSMVCLVC